MSRCGMHSRATVKMRPASSDAPRSGCKSSNHRQSHFAPRKFQTLRDRLECARRLGVLSETRT
eukprot:15294653-Alexandrium_andersonii.AAC.1